MQLSIPAFLEDVASVWESNSHTSLITDLFLFHAAGVAATADRQVSGDFTPDLQLCL